jgi:hypothetical protein
MSRYDEFRHRILESAATATRLNNQVIVTTWGLANEHGIPQGHIREELLRLAQLEFISLSVWDGDRERPYDDVVDKGSLFSNTADKRQLRIGLLDAGRELLHKTSKLDLPL